jgi:hypothetical protein
MLERSTRPISEKRGALRLRRTREAACVFDDGASLVTVRVRNLSPKGARIAGDGLLGLPPTVELRIKDSLGGVSARLARVVWLKPKAAGLEFVD